MNYSLDVNLTAHYRTCHALTPGMIERRCGRIVNIGSVNARAGRTHLVATQARGERPRPAGRHRCRRTRDGVVVHREKDVAESSGAVCRTWGDSVRGVPAVPAVHGSDQVRRSEQDE
ncbi:SDR family NAD(P)-dependent oxidoreductase [Streptomyces sp. NPDC058701]|uniref:SDR family NAD(P)-dependent oxidoreductase n=1 Tax=Streptomyces sp. NPDC058701 TaxID=3346608 RepID=UPI0036511F27